MNNIFWGAWVLLTTIMASYFGHKLLLGENKSDFLVGDSTYGHYQIEMACSTCHTTPFGGTEVLQKACVNCHGAELEAAHDSHPKKKFTDPRNAGRIETLDARYCITCHTEHQREQTRPMGLTLPEDYCFHCHKNIGEERESHGGLPFDSCASAGCHNYHDNRALYEDFLIEHARQPWLNTIALIPTPNAASAYSHGSIGDSNLLHQNKMSVHPEITGEWFASSHAAAGINCGSCHTETSTGGWIEKPGVRQCQHCHQNEVAGFVSGKHGMRLSQKLSSQLKIISPAESEMPFRQDSLGKRHGCNNCHGAHTFDKTVAAVESCLTCHNDEHSLSFDNSPHANLWRLETSGTIEQGSGVSCATCHMPRVEETINGKSIIHVEHNQNANLRPNEKMIRSVCMTCHSLEFSIDSLADPTLIRNNFSGRPGKHIESMDWALKRINTK